MPAAAVVSAPTPALPPPPSRYVIPVTLHLSMMPKTTALGFTDATLPIVETYESRFAVATRWLAQSNTSDWRRTMFDDIHARTFAGVATFLVFHIAATPMANMMKARKEMSILEYRKAVHCQKIEESNRLRFVGRLNVE
uniref:Uncharacterized protein n=1 Tax=Romanomermis culicivorax TaxID=13658 RepID=A0A915HPB5_ROMCU